ncbi:MAG: DUF3450 domain-containing protein [bacterium]|nr:DUF3450 domain-containing protein [bacterium]
MKNTLLYLTLALAVTSCGGDEEQAPVKPTVVEGGKETHITEKTTQNALNETLMEEYKELLKEVRSQDTSAAALEKRLKELTKGNDSLLQVLFDMQDTIDIHLPVKIPNDTTDHYFPPNGDTSKVQYKLFKGLVPAKDKNLGLIPKNYRGHFVNASKAQVIVSEKTVTYISPKKKKTLLFVEGADQRCREFGSHCLLEYDTGDGWAIVTLEVSSGNLAFRIIPSKAIVEDASSKREWKSYLETTRRELYQVFSKLE